MNCSNYTSDVPTVLGSVDILLSLITTIEKREYKTGQILAFCSDAEVLIFLWVFNLVSIIKY